MTATPTKLYIKPIEIEKIQAPAQQQTGSTKQTQPASQTTQVGTTKQNQPVSVQTNTNANATKQNVVTQPSAYDISTDFSSVPTTTPSADITIFGTEETGVVDYSGMTDEEIEAGYNEFIANLQGAGLKTTKLREGETNFAEYAAALSEEVAMEIIASFDSEADYVLQQEIAGLFKTDNAITVGDFVAALKSMGLEVTRESVSTSYISDAKAHNGVGEYRENGRIGIFTIRDPETGAEIKIPDANGNGAIEIEEVFMNDLLTGISKEIDKSRLEKYNGVQTFSGRASAMDISIAEMSEAQRLELELENASQDKSEEEIEAMYEELFIAREKEGEQALEIESLSISDKYQLNSFLDELTQQGLSDKEMMASAREWLEDNGYSGDLVDILMY